MIMEYLDGQTLANYKKKVTDEIKTQLSNQIKNLHTLNIIHQDLHQNNIMIVHKNKKVYVYLIDLGGSIIKNKVFNDRKMINYTVLDQINNSNNVTDLILLSYSLFKNNKINIIN
jgi:tRNA A-37 threonylcarbamoyl transferase component Bud32